MFADKAKDYGKSNAISDCIKLLNDTMDDLSMSQSVIQNLHGEYYGTGNRNADLKTWLSAAIENQYTCIEGFQGVQGLDKIKFINNLKSITLQISNILGMVSDVSFVETKGDNGNFQTRQWSSEKCLVSTFVVVAKDGSGNFTSIRDAVLSAPSKSKQKYTIYVKSGIYKENVEIKKDKWNLMLIGDGMDSTIITGDRSVIGSKHELRTFETATLSVSTNKSTFLGRPWRNCARTVFMQSYLGDTLTPEGWNPWNDKMRLDKLYYGEFKNFGPGANLDGRVKWPGYHVMNSSQAEIFTVAKFINGDLWLPSTGVTYARGLEAN
ncbi:Pectinesterase/pectinesterase inhibitor PPE8B [Thalictrum thalictroides]|uniref:Pectinesterase n=1 Tax=Thalictrum thalictroides TaxID=46969 RepID=A0A7J6W253_THATH|nr:Pectinesterase/pectinesterase inhibitor PPE8B [Thalictrum thalictroides]